MGGAFGHASIEQLRVAVSAAELEDVIASLQSNAVSATTVGPGSVYKYITPCGPYAEKFSAGQTRIFDFTPAMSFCGIPSTATGLVLHVTAQGAEADGFLSVFAPNEPMPWGGLLTYQAGEDSDHVVMYGGTSFNLFSQSATGVDIDIVGYFEAAPVARQNCTVTADVASFAPDSTSGFTLAPPACPSGSQQMAVFCRTTDRAARLRGSTASACVFEDAAPGDGNKGFVAAQARCCSVDN